MTKRVRDYKHPWWMRQLFCLPLWIWAYAFSQYLIARAHNAHAGNYETAVIALVIFVAGLPIYALVEWAWADRNDPYGLF